MPTTQLTVRELLLEYLESPRVTVVPGSDGITLEEVVDAYPLAMAAGQAPALEELQRRHPAQASELTSYFAAHNWPLGQTQHRRGDC